MTSTESNSVELALRSDVLVLTFSRPDQRNALDAEMRDPLRNPLRLASDDHREGLPAMREHHEPLFTCR